MKTRSLKSDLKPYFATPICLGCKKEFEVTDPSFRICANCAWKGNEYLARKLMPEIEILLPPEHNELPVFDKEPDIGNLLAKWKSEPDYEQPPPWHWWQIDAAFWKLYGNWCWTEEMSAWLVADVEKRMAVTAMERKQRKRR